MARSISWGAVLKKASPTNGRRNDLGLLGRTGTVRLIVSSNWEDGGLHGVSLGNHPSSESGLGGLGGNATGCVEYFLPSSRSFKENFDREPLWKRCPLDFSDFDMSDEGAIFRLSLQALNRHAAIPLSNKIRYQWKDDQRISIPSISTLSIVTTAVNARIEGNDMEWDMTMYFSQNIEIWW